MNLKQQLANQQNAQRSEGPRDTSNTRFNAVKHGGYSKKAVVTPSDGPDAKDRYSELLDDLTRSKVPMGRMEESLVERIANHMWQLERESRRATAETRRSVAGVIDSNEHRRHLEPNSRVRGSWETTSRMTDEVDYLETEVEALSGKDPLEARFDLWVTVFSAATEQFGVDVGALLELNAPWDQCAGYTTEDVQRVIGQACRAGGIDPPGFWKTCRADAEAEYQMARRKLDRRYERLEKEGLLAGPLTGITHIKLPGSKQRTILDESHRSITHGCRQPSNQAHKTISRRGELAAPGSGGGFHHVCTPFKLLRARTSPLVASLHL